MTEAALALSIAAMVLAVATIFFDILFYRWQTEQGARITGTVNDFAKEMHGVLGEIKGLTTGTRQELQEQFKFLLQAAVGQERVSIGEGLEERVATIEQRVAGVEERSQATDDAELTTMVGQLKRDVSSLQEGLAGLRQGAGAAGAGALPDRRAVEIAEGFLSYGRTGLPLLVEPPVVEPGGKVALRRVGGAATGTLTSLLDSSECEVRTPDGRVLSRSWLNSVPELVFPDDFRYASTELEGEYRVTVRHSPLFSITGEGREAVVRGQFYVRSSESHD